MASYSQYSLCMYDAFSICRGWQGLVAYASHSTVIVIDPRSIQPIQTLSAHKSNVIKVGVHLLYMWVELTFTM